MLVVLVYFVFMNYKQVDKKIRLKLVILQTYILHLRWGVNFRNIQKKKCIKKSRIIKYPLYTALASSNRLYFSSSARSSATSSDPLAHKYLSVSPTQSHIQLNHAFIPSTLWT